MKQEKRERGFHHNFTTVKCVFAETRTTYESAEYIKYFTKFHQLLTRLFCEKIRIEITKITEIYSHTEIHSGLLLVTQKSQNYILTPDFGDASPC